MLQSVLHHLGLELELSVVIEMLKLAAATLLIDRTGRFHPPSGGLQNLTNSSASVLFFEDRQLHFQSVSWSRRGHKKYESVKLADALPTGRDVFDLYCESISDF